MINKILLLLLLSFYSPVAFASFWDDIVNVYNIAIGCASDICNCGLSEDEKIRWENWDGQRVNKGKTNFNCPPRHKDVGRNDNTCLVNANTQYPGSWYYKNLCAEQVPDSTYFTPKIRVRGQQCNFAECWTTDNVLNWDGECVMLVPGYVVPLIRMCARIAVPADSIAGTEADSGYTAGEHINFEGATKKDDLVELSDGSFIRPNAPKLCLYSDPGVFNLNPADIINSFDPLDLNPIKQPFHHNTNTSPIVKLIITIYRIYNYYSNAGSGPQVMLASVVAQMLHMSQTDGETTFTSVLADSLDFVVELTNLFPNLVISAMKQVGQINRSVDATIYGCVNIPTGPYPPPYCESITPLSRIARTYDICPIDANGLTSKSTEGKECVVSTLRNNYVNNAIRVGYEYFVPLCSNGEDPMTNDKCVVIENLGPFSSASVLHLSTARRDIIRPCGKSLSDGIPCVRTMLPHTCSVSSNGCQDGFRIVYGTVLSNVKTQVRSYFRDDLDDCTGSTTSTCQKIWGIDTAEFVDISLQFEELQNYSNILPLTTDFTLVEKKWKTS